MDEQVHLELRLMRSLPSPRSALSGRENALASAFFRLLLVSYVMAAACASVRGERVEPGRDRYCPDGSALPGKTIVTMDCSLVVQYDAAELKASLSLDRLGEAGLKYSQAVLRQLDHAATEAQLHFTQTCRQYNSCQMTHVEFERARIEAQTFFRELREKLQVLHSTSGDPAATRVAFNRLYEQVVPPAERSRETLSVSLAVQAQDPPSSPMRVVHDGASLRTGAKVAFEMSVSRQAYAYLFQRKQDGKIDVLFPNHAITRVGNPLQAGTSIRLPPRGQVFTLNDDDLGSEHVFVAVSTAPIEDLERLLSQAHVEAAQVGDAVDDLVSQGNPECAGQARGLELTADAGCGSLTRGLTLTPESTPAAPANSLAAASLPGDNTIVRSFRFDHVP